MGYSPAKSQTWLSDWTKIIIKPSEGLTTEYPEAWVLYLQVWQEQDIVTYPSCVSFSAHHPILGTFDSQVQDTLWFRTEKRADRRSCRLRKKGEDRERDRDRKRQKKRQILSWPHRPRAQREKEEGCAAGNDHESGLCHMGNSEVQENWRVNTEVLRTIVLYVLNAL